MFGNKKKNPPIQYNRRHMDFDLQKEIKNGIRWHDNAMCRTATFSSRFSDSILSLGYCLLYLLRIETRILELWGSKAIRWFTVLPWPSSALFNCKSRWMTKWVNVHVQVIQSTLKMHESTKIYDLPWDQDQTTRYFSLSWSVTVKAWTM